MHIIGSFSSQGRRSYQQDRLFHESMRFGGHSVTCVAIADGMGGQKDGHLAATAAQDTLRRVIPKVFSAIREDGISPLLSKGGQRIYKLLEKIFKQANESVKALTDGTEDADRPGTTLVCVFIVDKQIWFANVGDSRAYLLTKAGLEQITRDDTALQDALDDGIITPEEAKTYPYGHILSKCLDGGQDVLPDISYRNLEDQEDVMVILSSDGFHNTMDLNEFRYLFAGHDNLDDQLARAGVLRAIEKGSTDNSTVVMCGLSGQAYQSLRAFFKPPKGSRLQKKPQPEDIAGPQTGPLWKSQSEKKSHKIRRHANRLIPVMTAVSVGLLLSVAALLYLVTDGGVFTPSTEPIIQTEENRKVVNNEGESSDNSTQEITAEHIVHKGDHQNDEATPDPSSDDSTRDDQKENGLPEDVTEAGEKEKTGSKKSDESFSTEQRTDNDTHSLKVNSGSGVTDIDGNEYETVIIGGQEWMAENLRVNRYRDSTIIKNPGKKEWQETLEGAKAVYPPDSLDGLHSEEDVARSYGFLYNWYAVNNNSGLCPKGWRVPSAEDWKTMVAHVVSHGYSNNSWSDKNGAGNALKSRRQYQTGGEGSTNDHPRWDIHEKHRGSDIYGFSGLPGGWRASNGGFEQAGRLGGWWTSTRVDNGKKQSIRRTLTYSSGIVNEIPDAQRGGWSVRCIKEPVTPQDLPMEDDQAKDTTGTMPTGEQADTNHLDQKQGEWHGDTSTEVIEVTNPVTGRTWMDRNLGASRAATSSTDSEAYGDLYQWGRNADGHQKRNSPTTSMMSSTDEPSHEMFIYVKDNPYDWRNPQNNDLWQGVEGKNNPCPAGYRLPSKTEWEDEIKSWNSKNAEGAYASPLKLPLSGIRLRSDGSLSLAGSQGYYWSNEVNADNSSAWLLVISDEAARIVDDNRADGLSVRCIKDQDNSDI